MSGRVHTSHTHTHKAADKLQLGSWVTSWALGCITLELGQRYVRSAWHRKQLSAPGAVSERPPGRARQASTLAPPTAVQCVAAHGLPLIITGEWETQQRPRVRLRGASFFRVGARRLCGS